jgi:hypothetical protein
MELLRDPADAQRRVLQRPPFSRAVKETVEVLARIEEQEAPD